MPLRLSGTQLTSQLQTKDLSVSVFSMCFHPKLLFHYLQWVRTQKSRDVDPDTSNMDPDPDPGNCMNPDPSEILKMLNVKF